MVPIFSSITNPPYSTILVFEYFISAIESFAKALPILEFCLSINNETCRQLVSSLESSTTTDERFKVTLAPFLFLILTY